MQAFVVHRIEALVRVSMGVGGHLVTNHTMSREVKGTSTRWFIVEVVSTKTAEWLDEYSSGENWTNSHEPCVKDHACTHIVSIGGLHECRCILKFLFG